MHIRLRIQKNSTTLNSTITLKQIRQKLKYQLLEVTIGYKCGIS